MQRREAALGILLLLLMSLTRDSSEALSTFGVSNTKPPVAKPTTPPDSRIKRKIMRRHSVMLVLALPFGLSLAAFSPAFGIIKPETPLPPSPTTPSARPCSRQAECAGISSSSCVRTHYDPVTRCLCGDNSPPLNGQCEAQAKSLYHACANSDECNEGLICLTPNITGTAPPHLRVHAPQDKICLCDIETGFKEKDHTCNDADILKTSLFAIITVTCIRKILTH